MSTLYQLTTITKRSRLSDFAALYESNGVEVNTITLGYGTTRGDLAGILHLTDSEKAVIFSFVTEPVWLTLKKALYRNLKVDVPDTGIAFITPLSSVGGKRELDYITDGLDFKKEEESVLKNTEVELIVTICNQGYNDMVMDAAREAGAAGGTVLHAQGTGVRKSEKFLGVTLATEKDVIYIVSKTEKKNLIMQAIMEKAGMNTQAKAVCFSLPVSDTAGINFYD